MNAWQENVETKIASLNRQYSQIEFQIQQVSQSIHKLPELICRRLLQEISDLPRHGSSLSLNEQPQSQQH